MGAVAQTDARKFGKYTLVAKLAIGGMAEIFLARLQGAAGFEKLVCIKRILPQFARDQQFVSMFLAEARIAAQISHPNVCQVFELGEIDGRYFIAMEYLEGVPLACFRRRDLYAAAPDPRLVAGFAAQACEGLHHAHQLKKPDGTPLEVVHRDVSGNNLFATVDGIVKVLDFGIAKVQDASVRTTTGSVKGTYAYMAPEQLRGERLDRRTDVFAMGIVLWELLCRRHLFKRETDFLTFQAITTDPIPDVCELRPDVPPELGAAIAKALSRSPDDRYATARALGEAIARAAGSLGGPMAPSTISEEVEQGFAVRLRDQRALIRIAREGGELDLENDLGPAVGHGTELMTTPLSIVSGLRAPDPRPEVQTSASIAIIPAPPVGPRSMTLPVQPLPPAPARRPVIPWAIAVGAIAAAVIVVVWSQRTNVTIAATPAAESAPAMPAATTIDAGVAATVTPDAAVAVAAVVVDAGAPVDAAPPAVVRTPRPPPKPPEKPTGPPGFITIDSTPVYAVIFIDGKRHGETPLVRLALAPGRHAVRAVSASGTTRNLTITIESGKVAPVRRIEW